MNAEIASTEGWSNSSVVGSSTSNRSLSVRANSVAATESRPADIREALVIILVPMILSTILKISCFVCALSLNIFYFGCNWLRCSRHGLKLLHHIPGFFYSRSLRYAKTCFCFGGAARKLPICQSLMPRCGSKTRPR